MNYPYPPPPPRPAPRKNNTGWIIAAVLSVVVIGCCGIVIAVGATGDPKPSAGRTTAAPPPVVATTGSQVPAVAAPVATTAAVKPATPTITDGTWTVGEDIPAGTYKPQNPIDPDALCYWAIYKSGTNQENIIQNDLGGGGLPKVTLKVGQDFETNRCGTWVKV